MKIYCCGCSEKVEARLTDGREIYPHRPDLYHIPFWLCDTCGAYVGCHWKKQSEHTKPLGYLATQEIRDVRGKIHSVLDPLWKTGKIKRKDAYAEISTALGYTFHTGNIKDLAEGQRIYDIVLELDLKTPL